MNQAVDSYQQIRYCDRLCYTIYHTT